MKIPSFPPISYAVLYGQYGYARLWKPIWAISRANPSELIPKAEGHLLLDVMIPVCSMIYTWIDHNRLIIVSID